MHATFLHVKIHKETDICGDVMTPTKNIFFNQQGIVDDFAAQKRDNMEVGKLKILLQSLMKYSYIENFHST